MSTWRPQSWATYPPCGRCKAPAGQPCRSDRDGTAIGKPHQGRRQPRRVRRRRYEPSTARRELTNDRLAVWKRLATRAVLVADIAHQLGMSRAALDRLVVRARQRGHPDAVYHASFRHFWHTRTGTHRRPC